MLSRKIAKKRDRLLGGRVGEEFIQVLCLFLPQSTLPRWHNIFATTNKLMLSELRIMPCCRRASGERSRPARSCRRPCWRSWPPLSK